MTSTEIKFKIFQYEQRINSNRRAINSTEKDYESLSAFKRKVSSVQSVFAECNSRRMQALQELKTIMKDCETAKRYYNGMKELVRTSGAKIVTRMLGNLIEMAQRSMRNYINKINKLENEIDSLRTKIEQLKKELELAEMREALENANK